MREARLVSLAILVLAGAILMNGDRNNKDVGGIIMAVFGIWFFVEIFQSYHKK